MGSQWFDYTGSAELWRRIPLRTVKKAFFSKNDTVRILSKLVLNSVMYDFTETATGGAVIVPPDYSTIEFISPDNWINYKAYENASLSEVLTHIVDTLNNHPVVAWDQFAKWLGEHCVALNDVLTSMHTCVLSTLDDSVSIAVDKPKFVDFDNSIDFVSMLIESMKGTAGAPLSTYKLDTAAFGFKLVMTSVPAENGEIATFAMGFLWRA